MYPLRLAFSGYSLIGATLLLMALAILFLIVRQPDKPRGAWLVAAFFCGIALSGASTVLANGLVFWSSLFAPWQDFWVIAGGVALARHACLLGGKADDTEARIALALSAAVALAALFTCLAFSHRFVHRWTPELDVPAAYYLLMPFATFLVVAIYLRRAVSLSRVAAASAGEAPPSAWTCLRHPPVDEARLCRNLALALALGFLPGTSMLFELPGTIAFGLQHLGAMLAVASVALGYLNAGPLITSFVAKLTGIALVTVLLLMGAIGNYHCEYVESELDREEWSLVARARAQLDAGLPLALPQPVSYVVAWQDVPPEAAGPYRLLFAQSGNEAIDLVQLAREDRRGAVRSTPIILPAELALPADEAWSGAMRWHTFPFGSNAPDYRGYRYSHEGTRYEIGLDATHAASEVSRVAHDWIIALGITSLLVLLVYPAFFRLTLVGPLMALLAGVKRANAGALDTALPVRYPDEIGQLTAAFNEMVRTLRAAHEELEQKIAARTREVSAFFDLAMLSDLDEKLHLKLRPALLSVMEAGKCDALCLHLCAEDGAALNMVHQFHVPSSALPALRSVAVPEAFAARLRGGGGALVTDTPPGHPALPAALRIASFPRYLGAPLGPGGRVHGWLSCYRAQGPGFGLGETSLLVALARQIGVIIENHLLQQRTGQLAALEERQRLARDLHDSVTQLMYSLTLFSGAGRQAVEDGDLPRVTQNLDKIADTAQLAVREMRSLLYELQPPSLEEAGLALALEQRLDIVERRVGIEVDSRIDESVELALPVQRELYHIAMETLNNSLRHAQADAMLVSLRRREADVEMIIADDGKGFDPGQPRRGLGLPGIRQRARRLGASVRIEATPGGGARTTITVPLGKGGGVA